MSYWKRTITALLAALLLWALAGCAVEEAGELTLRLSYVGAPATLDPAMATTDLERTLIAHLDENLMKLTAEGAVPGMARTYTCTDNLDGTETYTFTLREDAKWSDGTAVTANDFVYAWKRLASPDTDSPNREILSMVAGYEQAADGSPEALQVRAESAAVFSVDLNCHCSYFLTNVCTDPSTMPVRQDVAQSENWATQKSTLRTNGGYRLREWTADHLTLTADEAYYDEARLTVKELTFAVVNASADAQKAFDAGETDFVMGVGTVEGATTIARPDSTYLVVNKMADNLRNQNLRQAMSMVIDRNTMAAQLGEGYVPAAGLVSEGVHTTGSNIHFRQANGALVNNDPETYAERCQQAWELLKKTGYNTTTASYFGTITLLCLNTPSQQRCAIQIQKAWQEQLGLTVEIRSVAQEEWQTALNEGEFSAALLSVVPRCADAMEYMKDFATGKARNYGTYSDPAYDILMRTAAQSASAEARDAYLEDAERLLLESGYVIPLYGRQTNYLLRQDLTGIFDNGMGQCYFTGIYKVEEN